MVNKRVIVALDCDCADSALALADALPADQCRLKIGKELFTRAGPALVDTLQRRGFEIFLDLKFHDIPNTVAGAVRAAADLGVWMINVHASGGRRMMEAAREALAGRTDAPLLIGVTVLTSLAAPDLAELGETRSPSSVVSTLAALAARSGLDGVVCSALEAPMLRRERGDDFCLVTPGIRMAGEGGSDQRRIVTPVNAVAMGADYLVVGRSITAAADPSAALQRVLRELDTP
ncbi:MAG: orotidine-5'-phosphate decarboxylase [Halioglobus sp.]|nr:orotidine-5'-phosphate decarboxylase [Halioglobus sp.]